MITYGSNGSLIVTPASLTIAVGNTTKSFGTSPNYATSFTGLVAGDTSSVVSGLTISSAGATSTAATGIYSISDSGATAANYTITYGTNGSLTVTAAAITITTISSTKTYGSTATYTTSYTGFINGDTSSVVSGLTISSGGATSTAGVGTYAITDTGATASNYIISYGINGSLTVTPAALTISTGSATKTYGTAATFTTTYNGLVANDTSAVVSGLAVSSTGAAPNANVGTYSIADSGAAASNYTVIYGTNGSLTVMPASLTIDTANASKVYGATPSYSSSYIGLVAGNTSSVVSGLTVNSTGATSTAGVGTYAIIDSGAAAANYTITYGTNGSLTVTPASLTISASNVSRLYGAGNPGFSASYGGLVAGDTTSAVSGLTLTTTAATNSNVGSYAITAANGTANNYTITYGQGTLTVDPAPLTVTASNGTRLYGGTNSSFSASYVGLVAGDTSSVVTGLTFTTAATTNSGVGSYAVTASAVAGNYAITYVNGTLTITPAPLTISVNDISKPYGYAPVYSSSYVGLVGGDSSTAISGLTYTSAGATSTAALGTYTITEGGATAGNYNITYGSNGVMTVTQAPLTITANSVSRPIGQGDPVFSATFSGLVNGDTTNVVTGLTFSSNDTVGSPPGYYEILVTGSTALNYDVIYRPGELIVFNPALENQASGPVINPSNNLGGINYISLTNLSQIISAIVQVTPTLSFQNTPVPFQSLVTFADANIPYSPAATLNVCIKNHHRC
jgi:hypothetical protein